jgi:hypothetical protein
MPRLLANHKRPVYLFLLLCSFSFDVLSIESAKISVSVTDTPFGQAVTASTEVSFTPSEFLNLVKNAQNDCSWIENCANVKVFEGTGSDYQLVQTEIASPWPFKNRVMLVYSSLFMAPDMQSLTITLSDALDKTPEQDQNLVRMSNVSGEWKMERLKSRAIEATSTVDETATYRLSYTGTGLANGNIPSWIALTFLKSSTEKTFENLVQHFNTSPLVVK